MNFDIRYVPFSRYGSYFSLSYISKEVWGKDYKVNKEGLYLRTLHGNAKQKEIFLLEPIKKNRVKMDFKIENSPEVVKLKTSEGEIKICIPDPDTVRIVGSTGIKLSLENSHSFLIPIDSKKNNWFLNFYGGGFQAVISVKSGILNLNAPWTGTTCSKIELNIFPKKEDFEILIKEVDENEDCNNKFKIKESFDESVKTIRKEFEEFLEKLPKISNELLQQFHLAGYILWSSVVKPHGFLKRPAVLMSKNWMTDLWSWDHCFNAIALSYKNFDLAWDQFMVIFDSQNNIGAVPDYINDYEQFWNFIKPPIHGWTFKKLLENMYIEPDKLKDAYDCLSALTNWWLKCRDYDGDGIPQYNHGNDSGWDNSTVFIERPPIESPDLSAFLIIQMDTLSEIAKKLGDAEKIKYWKSKSDELYKKFLEHFLVDDRLVPKISGDHKVIDSKSLLPLISLILGKRLPEKVTKKAIEILVTDYLTNFGLATESPKSKFYNPDGYWRGPIWAPSTLLMIEALKQLKRNDLVFELSKRFIELIKKGGFAENFNALTGEGLRDRAHTWTASTFLIIAKEYYTNL